MAGGGDHGEGRAMAHFADLVARPEENIPLDEAALMIAYQARPGLDVGAELARLDDLAASCQPPTFDGLVRHLFVDLGFRGNAEHYQEADNSYLDQVLRRRVGIPISLSVLTMEVGRRLGVVLDGVGLPGHFLVRHRADPGVFLDPFGGGQRLDAAGCRAIFAGLGGTGWNDAYLEPVGARAILNRMLLNLQSLFLPADLPSAAWVLQLRLTIPGLAVADRLGLARALGSLGLFAVAAAELDRVADSLHEAEAATLRAEALGLRARAN
jgi:regulator of sirC expression with transglutaminase-like and TPR domain